jgi:hypothetical protein
MPKKSSCPPLDWKFGKTITGMQVKTCRKCNRTMYFYPTVVGGPKRWHLNPP